MIPVLQNFVLQPEHIFDVAEAARSLAKLAEAEPDAQIALTVAQITEDGGLEEEAKIVMPVEQAAALLATVGADQRVPGVLASQQLYIIRLTKSEHHRLPRA